MHVRSSTVQDSNTDNRAVRETVEKRYSQDKLCMGFQNFLEQLLFRFKDRKRTIRTIPNSEAVIRRCSVKIVFLEISQNSQENACARASFLIKFIINLVQVFSCEFCEISKNTVSYRTSPVAASASCVNTCSKSTLKIATSKYWLLYCLYCLLTLNRYLPMSKQHPQHINICLK